MGAWPVPPLEEEDELELELELDVELEPDPDPPPPQADRHKTVSRQSARVATRGVIPGACPNPKV
jgi:hypothetical protein